MARETFEFFCSHCPADPVDPKADPKEPRPKAGAYFFVNWDMDRTGQFLFICPNCKREHARTISAGQMKSNDSEARFIGGESKKISIFHDGGGHKPGWERIIILKSAWHRKQMLELQKIVPCGYLAERWLEKAAKEKGALLDDTE